MLSLAFLSAPAGAIGPDPIVEDERHRVSALMIQAHLEAADNSTVEGAERAKEEDAIIPQVSASQSLIELQKDEMTLHRDIRAAENEVPNIESANTMPGDIRLTSTGTLDTLASGPSFDGKSGLASFPADALEPSPDDTLSDGTSSDPLPARPSAPANAISDFPAGSSGEDAEAVMISNHPGSTTKGKAGAIVERGSFQLELSPGDAAPALAGPPSGDPDEKDRIIF